MIPEVLQSSVDPRKISETIKGIVMMLISLVPLYFSMKGYDPLAIENAVSQAAKIQASLMQNIDTGVLFVSAGLAAYHSIQATWGLFQKGVVKVGSIFSKPVGVVPPTCVCTCVK